MPSGGLCIFKQPRDVVAFYKVAKDGTPAFYNITDSRLIIDTANYIDEFDNTYTDFDLSCFFVNGNTYFSIYGYGEDCRKTIFINHLGEVINSFENCMDFSPMSEQDELFFISYYGNSNNVEAEIPYNIVNNIVLEDKYSKTKHGSKESYGKLISDGKWYSINNNGTRVEVPIPIPEGYDIIGTYGDLLAIDSNNRREGIISKDGTVIVEPGKYDMLESRSENMIMVLDHYYNYGFIDMQGNEVIPCQFDSVHSFSEGLASVQFSNSGKWGFIDKTGNKVISDDYSYATSFDEGIALVKDGSYYKFIDKVGNTVIDITALGCDYTYSFSCGLAAVRNAETALWGFIDKSGELVIPFEYEDVNSFDDDTAYVFKDGKWFYIDKTGTDLRQNYVYLYSDDGPIEGMEYNGKIIINATGEEIDFAGTGMNPYIVGDNQEYIIGEQNGIFYQLLPKTVTVSLNGKNGTLTGGGSYVRGTDVTVSATPDSGYVFNGWYINDEKVSSSASYTFTANENIELTAVFKAKKSSGGGGGGGGVTMYTVKFESNTATATESQNVRRNSTVKEPETPTKDGYTFAGWFTDKDCTTLYDFASRVTHGFTLYAGWTEIDSTKMQFILTIGKKDASVFGETKTNDVAPIIRNDRTMLPARFIAENLGAKVEWDERGIVTITKDDITIIITIDSDTATVNGKEFNLDSPAFIENDRTYTPVRFIVENLGAKVEWNEKTQEVIITK